MALGLESLPKEILTCILLELNARDMRSMLCSSAVIRHRCIDVLMERWPLILLYDSKDVHNPFKRRLNSQYKLCNEVFRALIHSGVPLKYYRMAHFKNKSTQEVAVKYLKLSRKKHLAGAKMKREDMFCVLKLCTGLRFFKFDVANISYLIQIMDKLPCGLKAFEIDITSTDFYKGKASNVHVTKLNMTANKLKCIKVCGNAKYTEWAHTSSREIRHAISHVGLAFPNERQIQQILRQSDSHPSNKKLLLLCKIVAQLVAVNSQSIQTIEIFNMDAYHIMRYKRALTDLPQLRVIKVDCRSLARLERWKHRFLDASTRKMLFVPNERPLSPWLIVFPWDYNKNEECCGLQKTQDGSIIQVKFTGSGHQFWKRFKYA